MALRSAWPRVRARADRRRNPGKGIEATAQSWFAIGASLRPAVIDGRRRAGAENSLNKPSDAPTRMVWGPSSRPPATHLTRRALSTAPLCAIIVALLRRGGRAATTSADTYVARSRVSGVGVGYHRFARANAESTLPLVARCVIASKRLGTPYRI